MFASVTFPLGAVDNYVNNAPRFHFAVLALFALVGVAFLITGIHAIRTRTAEESGQRRLVRKLMGKSTQYEGRIALAIGIARCCTGVAAIIFAIVFLLRELGD